MRTQMYFIALEISYFGNGVEGVCTNPVVTDTF